MKRGPSETRGGAGDTAPALPETDSMYIQTDNLQKSDGQNRYVPPRGEFEEILYDVYCSLPQ